jgi:hypothetical protein
MTYINATIEWEYAGRFNPLIYIELRVTNLLQTTPKTGVLIRKSFLIGWLMVDDSTENIASMNGLFGETVSISENTEQSQIGC